MPSIVVSGNSNHWINTGIPVEPGQWIRITASGWIGFALGGWHRSPDGVDPNGQGLEYAHAGHPGPELVKNSLIAHINGHTIQAGSNVAFRAPAGGPLYLMANDDFRGDNGGSWQVNVDVGVLRQRLLVITQGAIDSARAKLIADGIAQFKNLVWNHSENAIAPEILPMDIDGPVDLSEMVPPAPGSPLRVATYSTQLHQLIAQRGIPAESVDGIFRFYVQPPNAGNYAYWTLGTIPNLQKRIGYSAIGANLVGPDASAVATILLREYLQQLDVRFHEAGVPGFRHPNSKPQSDLQFFAQIMRTLENGTPPPYGRLHGVFGRLG